MSIPPPVSPGDQFEFPASFFNLTREAVDDFVSRESATLETGEPLNAGEVRVQNESGGVLVSGDVVELGPPVDDPADGAAATKPTMEADTPSADGVRTFAVMVAGCADGDTGRAVVCGAAVCLIDVEDESHGFASAASASKKLESGHVGPARILWKQAIADRATAGVAVAVVLLGAAQQPGIVWGTVTAASVTGDGAASTINYGASGGGLSVTGATPMFRNVASDIELTAATVGSTCALGLIDGAAALLWTREVIPGDECA